MTAIKLSTRPVTKAQASRALYAAIDEAALDGRLTPCRLSHEFDAEDLDAAAAAQLVERCSTECPVLQQCADLALLLPADYKQGSVIAGIYYSPAKTARWQTVYDGLRDRIETGEYAPGNRLPSITELASAMELHGNVIRAALDHLERDGLVVHDGSDRRMVVAYGTIVGSRQHILDDPQAEDAGRPATAAQHIGQVA